MNYLAPLGFVFFVIAWFAVAHSGLINPLFIEPPEAVAVKLGEIIADGSFVTDLGVTVYRTLAGFALAAIIGVPLGIALGHSKTIYRMFEPFVDFVRSIPASALFPLFLLFFTIGDLSKIAVVIYGSGLLITINTMYGVFNSNKTRALLARTFGADDITVLKKVEFYESLPYVFAGFRIAISISLILVIITEMFLGFTSAGLGMQIYDNYQVRQVADMYSYIIITGILGYVLNLGMKRIEKSIVHWAGK